MKVAAALALVLVGAVALAGVEHDLATPRGLHDVEYARAAQCQRCHPDHSASFGRTFHRTMTQQAGGHSVRGEFDGQTLDYFGVRARLTRGDDGGFRVGYQLPGAAPERFDVVMTVGSRRYQQYIARRGGELVRLPVAYHLEERRWFHMNGAFLTPDPALPLARVDYERHVTRWNDNCVFCHNVAPNPGKTRGRDGDHFDTQVAELGIACEACHGPGEEHARANANPLRRYVLHLGDRADPSIVNPARLAPARALDVCGRCHGQRITDDVERFLRHGDPFVPGDDLALYSAPLWRDTTLRDEPAFTTRFWADGTPRLTAYEYQGTLQSPCAQRGELTCLSCHGMHDGDPRGQLRPDRLGAAACTQCHAQLSRSEAQARHAGHPSGASLPECVDCHMPKLVYGVLDTHRSHRIEIPSVARAELQGRPDACTQCHVDRTRAWAREAEARLWPKRDAAAVPRAHDGGEERWSEAETRLFAGDPIERALAASALGRSPAASAHQRRLALLLEAIERDPYPAIRHLAVRSARALLADPALDRFIPEQPEPARSAQLAALRARFALSPDDLEHAAALRTRASALAIDIGE